MIERWDICGVTTNPTIFGKAITAGADYEQQIARHSRLGKSPAEVYEIVVLEDAQKAADILRDVYDETNALDGLVSIEVSPHLVHDAAATTAEARRFWQRIERPNVMIKVPATTQGLLAIRQLISEGINVNATLLFSIDRYLEVIDAYTLGLEDAVGAGRAIDRISSVASFFLSRIDTMIDPLLDTIAEARGPNARIAGNLVGETAIASAKHAYGLYTRALHSERFGKLAQRGARAQRLLWASTSTKNPAYSDIKYVEALIGAGTINTMTPDTLAAYDKHGSPKDRLREGARDVIDIRSSLASVGIDLQHITNRLLDEGIAKFQEAIEKLLHTIQEKQAQLRIPRR